MLAWFLAHFLRLEGSGGRRGERVSKWKLGMRSGGSGHVVYRCNDNVESALVLILLYMYTVHMENGTSCTVMLMVVSRRKLLRLFSGVDRSRLTTS